MTHSQFYNNPHYNSKIPSKKIKREARRAKEAKHPKVRLNSYRWNFKFHYSPLFRQNSSFSFIFYIVKSRKYSKNTIVLGRERWLVYCALDNDSLQSIKVFERMRLKVERWAWKQIWESCIDIKYQMRYFITLKWIFTISLTHANLCARHYWLLAVCSKKKKALLYR